MSWETGNQPKNIDKEDINRLLLDKGFLEEKEAKILLYKFLRENITFTTGLLSGVDLFPFQHMAIKSMFETDYFLGIWSRGMSKSFTTGVYAFLDAILNQGVEIGILAASFRQSKQIFKKIEDIAAKPEAQMLAGCITKKSKSNDEWLMEIGRSRIRALPLGDGSKLRGFRFHRIIIDEMLLMPERVYNEVIVPFLSVVENPTQREELYNLETNLIKKGEMKEEDRYRWPNNKLIMLSSASYKFEYLYKLYSNFEGLILNHVDHKDGSNARRSIMHFSYDCAPKQLYDVNLINQSKATMSQSQFDREFNAIFTDDSSGYFKTSRMADCTIRDGEGQCVEIAGEPDAKYILAIDPSWAESESSDDFAMQVLKLNDEKRSAVLVHSYAMAGTRLQDHMFYFKYLIDKFNIISIVADYMGGVQFINAVNESSIFKKENINFKQIDVNFDDLNDYQNVLKSVKQQYNQQDRRICFLRKPSSDWIRRANESLQANFDHKKIWFGSRAIDEDYAIQRRKKVPITKLKFLRNEEKNQSPQSKMIDLIEHQYDLMNLTKSECALIQIKTSPQGTQTFDLPDNLKRQTGPEKTRKDSYSALVLGNWMVGLYYEFTHMEETPQYLGFTPMFIK